MLVRTLLFITLTSLLFTGCTTPSLKMPTNFLGFNKTIKVEKTKGGLIIENGLKYSQTYIFDKPLEKNMLIKCGFDNPNPKLAPLMIENRTKTSTKTLQIISPKIAGVYKTNQDYFINLKIFKDDKLLLEHKEKMILKMKE